MFQRGSCGQITLSLDFKSQTAGLQSDLTTISIPVTYQQEEQVSKTLLTMTPQEIANWIDRRSRIYFPLAFFIFNCFYWTWTILFWSHAEQKWTSNCPFGDFSSKHFSVKQCRSTYMFYFKVIIYTDTLIKNELLDFTNAVNTLIWDKVSI